MLWLLDDGDDRQQVELDSEMPIKWKLGCGAIAGAVGQSGDYHMTQSNNDIIDYHMTCFHSNIPSGCPSASDADERIDING